MVEADLDCDPPARVMVHHGTRETAARAVRRDSNWSLRCEQPLVVAPGDRLVIRTIAPPDTLGGGVVLSPAPPARVLGVAVTPARTHAAPAEATWDPATEAALRTREPPPGLPEADLAALRAAGRAVRVGPDLHFHTEELEELRAEVVALLPATLAEVRDGLGTSRRYAQALLEHFDGEGLTLRRGDVRVLRRRRRQP